MKAFKISPEILNSNYTGIKRSLFVFVFLIVSALMVFGYYNTLQIHVSQVRIDIKKTAGDMKSLNIAMISDIHLSRLIKNDRMREIVEKINSLNPDLLLIPGDIVDNLIEPFIEQNIGELLLRVKSRFGIYAVTGNHEFFGDFEKTMSHLSKYIRFLNDRSVMINNSFYLIGRIEPTGERYYNRKRAPLSGILRGVNKNYPLILMDHRPILEDALENGIDLQLSGHTHHGQFFPLNLITAAVYDLSWGYLKKGNSHFYTTCGIGTWGPPVRIGSVSEVVNILITFSE